MIQIQNMFKNGKQDIVLKTVKGFNIIRTPFIILIPENSFKLGIVVLVMLYKMFRYGPESQKKQFFNLLPFLTLSVRNRPSVSFGANVPCSYKTFFSHLIILLYCIP